MIIGFGSGDRRKLTQIHHPNKFSSTSGCIFGHLRRIDSWLEFSTGPLRPNGTGWQLVRLSNPTASDAMKKPSGVKYSTALVKMASPDRIFVSHTWNYTNKKVATFALMIKFCESKHNLLYFFAYDASRSWTKSIFGGESPPLRIIASLSIAVV